MTNKFWWKKWYVTYQKKKIPFTRYISEMYSHPYVLSPEGNGLDCHRTWEALYAGTIPVVKQSPHINGFMPLPLFRYDSLSDITEHSLLQEYPSLVAKFTTNEMLRFSFWANKIKKISGEVLSS
jgi:hypothetical protein